MRLFNLLLFLGMYTRAEGVICPSIDNEEECVENIDARTGFVSPCVWCCGKVCESGRVDENIKCEPLAYLQWLSDIPWDGKGIYSNLGIDTNSCHVESESPSTSGPTTIFDGQNYTIQEPDVTFQDADGQFKLDFLYKVGATADSLRFSLFRTGCNDSNVTNIISTTQQTVVNSVYSKEVSIDKTEIEGSVLVVPVGGLKGFSAGSLNFCVKAETLEETISVSFLKTEVSLTYDLTENSFSVTENSIEADDIKETATTISTKYGVDAFRCKTSDGEKISGATELEQNSLVGICLEPLPNSTSAVKISNYDMNFTQGGVFVFAAAEFGASAPKKASALSQVTSFDNNGVIRHKVVSRLITALFDGEETAFEVVGNAYLEFKTTARNLRQLDDYVEGSAEDAPFSLSIEIKKTASGTSDEKMKSSLVFSVVGATLAVTVGFVLYKKLA